MKTKITLKLLLITSLLLNFVNSQAVTRVEWVDSADIFLTDLDPAGVERSGNGNLTLYVARGQHIYPNTFIPGKFHPHEASDHAEISYDGKEFKVPIYQFLRYPPGTVSWIPGKGAQIVTPNHIFGGVDPEFTEEVYVCRAWHQHQQNDTTFQYLLPGKFVPSKGICSVPYG